MDRNKAQDIENRLRGIAIDGWIIDSFIDNGKSAAVFKARKGDQTAALKIFDDELIARYGDRTQLKRIDRELLLVGREHPNLVEILGGGVDHTTNNHYIVMGFVSGPSLRKGLSEVPADGIPQLMSQLASAAKFLEELGL